MLPLGGSRKIARTNCSCLWLTRPHPACSATISRSATRCSEPACRGALPVDTPRHGDASRESLYGTPRRGLGDMFAPQGLAPALLAAKPVTVAAPEDPFV